MIVFKKKGKVGTYFCIFLRAPQNSAFSGMGNSVLLVASGLTTLT